MCHSQLVTIFIGDITLSLNISASPQRQRFEFDFYRYCVRSVLENEGNRWDEANEEVRSKKGFNYLKKKLFLMLRVAIFCWIPYCHSSKCNIKQENPTGGISLHISRCWKGELQACVWLFIESTFSFTAPKDTLWIHNMTMRFREFFEQRTKYNLLFTLRASKKIDFLLHPACFAKTILHCRRIWED